jgi:hypothetical protein
MMRNTPKKPRRPIFAPLRLQLPPHTGLEGIEIFAQLDKTLARLGHGHNLSPHLLNHQHALREYILNGGQAADALHDARDVRVLLHLWREDPQFLVRAPLDKTLLKTIQALLPAPSRLFLWQLVHLFLEHYDGLTAWRELGQWLLVSIEKIAPRPHESPALSAYRQHCRALFGKDAPSALLQYAQRHQLHFPTAAKTWHLPDTSRIYARACRRYYLEPLEKLKSGHHHPLLDELCLAQVQQLPMPDRLLLGHHACRILMDTCLTANANLADNWRHLILTIMGDPRVPRSSPQFQQWWGRLEKKYAQAMRRWLSQLDLKLFLDILEEVARRHDKQDLLRMFPARKRFLEGLQHLGLIKESRLLLGSQAEKYVREHIDSQDLPQFASLSSADVSLIYLNLGSAHLLEGTHTFQVRIYHLLNIPGLGDYEADKFSLSTLRKYTAAHTIRHAPSKLPRWQYELIETLTLAPFHLKIDPRAVLSATDYAAYQQAYV